LTQALIVEDDPKIRAHLLFQLRDEGFAATAVESAEAALAHLTTSRPDLLLLDVRLPGLSGVDLVRQLVAGDRLPPTIILSGEASISEVVEALQLGVHDFIEKPFRKERLLRSIRNTLESNALRREVAHLRTELGQATEILGASPALTVLREQIQQVAATDARVLIRGESGSGKELVADAVHRHSRRREGPFVKLNCAAIPPQLVEDEIFGHVAGAFTDARSAKVGLFEEADGGTLFLDEIGDMDLALQGRLLRILEDGRVRRLGEARDRQVDVRVLAATHADLELAVREGRFREDLYFRLAHLPLEVPPLRARGSDIRVLFDHFLEGFCRRHRTRQLAVDEEVYRRLEQHAWPGNVRELKAVAERLSVFGVDPLTPNQLPPGLGLGAAQTGAPQTTATGTGATMLRFAAGDPVLPLREFRARCEKEYIEAVLRQTGWNVSAAARLLELGRTHLHQKLAELGTKRPGSED
jgi:DNA-binding NtrC family response regulator